MPSVAQLAYGGTGTYGYSYGGAGGISAEFLTRTGAPVSPYYPPGIYITTPGSGGHGSMYLSNSITYGQPGQNGEVKIITHS